MKKELLCFLKGRINSTFWETKLFKKDVKPNQSISNEYFVSVF
ncbi:hypothetical protein DDD_2693 [Nonlabens dokdonensis DSW-6]|uniref:Uncharacterized protein n=1 Tax=Nonlabens dokdonensis (strain DSM 17205 / KCTC 12402 / DSW-6) TaxID=592029 RepID=L7W825_NONDD|nr:hypothetical protein DDD_2693 [Nonlabens dokdonensis DSW-6]